MRQLPTEGPCLSKSLMRKCIIPHTCHTGSVCDLWFHQIPLGKRFKHVDATWRQAGTSEMFWSIPNCFSHFFMSGDDQHQGESQDHRHLRYWRAPGEVERMQRANRHAYYIFCARTMSNISRFSMVSVQFSCWEWGFGGLIWFEDDSAQITLDMVQKGLEDYLETKRPLEGWEDCNSSMKYLDSWRFHKHTSHQTEMILWNKIMETLITGKCGCALFHTAL